MAFYSLFVPSQAVGASLVYFDLFNAAGSGCKLALHSVIPVVSGAVAVTGLVGVDIFLTRTTAVGTGGTAATLEGTSLTAATFSALEHTTVLSPSITARLTPTGGATAGAVLEYASLYTEETNSAAYNAYPNMVRIQGVPDIPATIIREGSGIRVVQGSVASVGNIGFNVTFDVWTPNA